MILFGIFLSIEAKMDFKCSTEGQKAQKPQQTRIEHSDGSDLSGLWERLERNFEGAIHFNLLPLPYPTPHAISSPPALKFLPGFFSGLASLKISQDLEIENIFWRG
jgi:hypothetical protein